jgi:hypothetical protein
MRYVNTNLAWAIPATLAIAVVWLVSAVANYYFGASLGTHKPFEALFFTTTTAQLFSSASLAADVLKCVTLFAFAASMTLRLWRAAVVTGSIWLVCTAWSVASAVGFVAINHNTVTDTRGKGVEEWSQLDSQIKNLSERRKQVAPARPEGTVQAEINQLLRTPGVGNCSVINGPAMREICPQVDKLKVELENAKSAAWLDGRLDELRTETHKSDRVTSENPFADLAGGLLGVVATEITTGQALWFALLLELISGPGLWAIWSAVPKTREVEATAAKAEPVSLVGTRLDPQPVALSVAPRTPMKALEAIAGVKSAPKSVERAELVQSSSPDHFADVGNMVPDPDGPGTPAPAPEEPVEEVAERKGPSLVWENDAPPIAPRAKKRGHKPEGKVESWLGASTTQVDDPNIKTSSADCWRSYLAYCEEAGKQPMHRKVFSRKLGVLLGRASGKGRKRDSRGSVFTGLMINPVVMTAKRVRAA